MSIECALCEGTGAHDFTGFTGEIETETCTDCDGTGKRTCDMCDNSAVREVHGSYVALGCTRKIVDYLCNYCYSEIEGNA